MKELQLLIQKLVGARGGNRTHTPVAGKGILSRLRLLVND
jgi:hypothetical protein